MIKEILAKTALHYHEKTFATNWDLNIYRGCSHNCQYCFAQYSHKYLENNQESGFFNDIFVKINIAEILDKELSKKSWKGDTIQISGVSDCYQPLEKKYKLMESVLKVLIKHKQPISILTKSPLILRDYDLINELSRLTYVSLGTTVTTINDSIRKIIEPGTFPSIERLKALKEFTKTNCETTVMLMPIIPYLTDNIRDIEELFKIISEYKIDNIICGSLHLRGDLKKNFYNFLKSNFLETYQKIQHLYKGSYASKEYREKLNDYLFKMRKKYKIHRNKKVNIEKILKENTKEKKGQLELF